MNGSHWMIWYQNCLNGTEDNKILFMVNYVDD